MDMDKIKQQHQDSFAQLAQTQASHLIGKAVLQVLAQGQHFTVDALAQEMRQSVTHLSAQDFGRMAVEGAITILLDAARQDAPAP